MTELLLVVMGDFCAAYRRSHADPQAYALGDQLKPDQPVVWPPTMRGNDQNFNV